MTLLFFITALFWGWLAYNLYRPLHGGTFVVGTCFLWGMIVGEAVPFIVAFEAAGLIIFASAGAVQGFWGNLGLIIILVSWAAMLNHYRKSFHAKENIEDAIADAVGKDYKDKVDPSRAELFSDRPDIGLVARPWHVDRKDVERIKNIVFDKADGINLKLDIYRHKSKPQNCPVLLQIHGGGWIFGTKNEQARPLMNHLAARGWIAVSINYRLSPRATFPDHIIDCKKAFAWIKKNIREYGGNPDFIIVTGGSAGGHLSSLFALSANDPLFQPGFEDVDTRVQGCVPFYGIYDFADTNSLHTSPDIYRLLRVSIMKKSKKTDLDDYHRASPLFRVHPDAPPFLIIHGDTDILASVEEARIFAAKLKETSKNPVAYAEIDGAQHAFDIFNSVRCEYAKLGIERFVNYIYDMWLKEQKR